MAGSKRFDTLNPSNTESGGKLVTLVDYYDATSTITQANASFHPTVVASDAGFGGKKVVQFSSASTNFMTSNKTGASWRMHDGTGWTTIMVAQQTAQTQYFYSTWSSGTTAGVALANVASGSDMRLYVIGSSPAGTVVDQGTGFAMGTDPTYIAWDYLEGRASPGEVLISKGGATQVTDNSNIAPTNADAAVTFNLGRRANGSSYASMKFAALYVIPDALLDNLTFVTDMEDYFLLEWGISPL